MEINDIKKTRWNFIGLSSEEKPVPETSPDVVNGSTFYEVDTSKLYFWTDGFWYDFKWRRSRTRSGQGITRKNLPQPLCNTLASESTP